MKYVPRKQLAHWYTGAYGGEHKFHADMIAAREETPLEALLAVLQDNIYLNSSLPHGATMHFEISINDSEVIE